MFDVGDRLALALGVVLFRHGAVKLSEVLLLLLTKVIWKSIPGYAWSLQYCAYSTSSTGSPSSGKFSSAGAHGVGVNM